MPSTLKNVSLPKATEPKRSKFREDFNASFIESIIDPTVTPTDEAGAPASDSSLPTNSSKPPTLLPMILRQSRLSWSSWSSGSRKSSTSAALKKLKRSPIKKLQDSARKLLRSGSEH